MFKYYGSSLSGKENRRAMPLIQPKAKCSPIVYEFEPLKTQDLKQRTKSRQRQDPYFNRISFYRYSGAPRPWVDTFLQIKKSYLVAHRIHWGHYLKFLTRNHRYLNGHYHNARQ